VLSIIKFDRLMFRRKPHVIRAALWQKTQKLLGEHARVCPCGGRCPGEQMSISVYDSVEHRRSRCNQ